MLVIYYLNPHHKLVVKITLSPTFYKYGTKAQSPSDIPTGTELVMAEPRFNLSFLIT